MAGEAAHVHLVNDGPGGRPVQGRVAFPIVGAGIDDDAFHGRRRVIALDARRFTAIVLGNNHAAAIGIQENLVGIKPHSARRIERPLDAIAIELPGLHIRDEYVPVMVGAVRRRVDRNHARGHSVVFAVEENQLHAGSAARIDAEIHASRDKPWRRAESFLRYVASASFTAGPTALSRWQFQRAYQAPCFCWVEGPPAAARSASTKACSRRTRPAGMD